MTFPKEFLLGAATAAHQVEGNNIHSDYWLQEHMPHTAFAEPSGEACDHYNRYEEDIKLLAKAGLNAYRFSIEWARIEPEENRFDESEVEHYKNVIACCRKYNVEPIVTLLHFTSPAWVIRKGGWEAESVVDDFKKYTSYIVSKIGDNVKYICTINEANMGLQVTAIERRYRMIAQRAAQSGGSGEDGKKTGGGVQVGFNLEKLMENQRYLAAENQEAFGVPSPQIFVGARSEQGDAIVMKAHVAARNEIKSLYPDIKVGITLSLHDIQSISGGEAAAEAAWNEEFEHYLPFIKDDDFLGVQNYSRLSFGPEGQLPPSGPLTQMEYEDYPQALENVIRKVSEKFKSEIIVTENGIATDDDTRRIEFIEQALGGLQKCVNDGLPVKGYLYWSLLDNFEWQKGYSMTFGLISVDRATQKRSAKGSLAALGAYAEGESRT